jgi:hypothetical protein
MRTKPHLSLVPAAIARVVGRELGIVRAAFGFEHAPPPGGQSFGYGTDGPLKMAILSYPILVIGDELLAMACIPARLVAAHIAVAVAGIYGFVWLLGLYRSMQARPHRMERATLRLHRGILGSMVVSLEDIVAASPVEPEEIARLGKSTARLDIGGERVLLTLREPITLPGAFGSRTARTLVVSADDPRGLCSALARAGASA